MSAELEDPRVSIQRARVVVPGEPRSKARPRFGRGHAYSDKTQKAHETLIGESLRKALTRPLPGNLSVELVFYRSNAHRIDVDNLVKAVLDGANGIAWVDDIQVTRLLGVLELDRDNPRTEITIASTTSTMKRGGETVEVCGGCGAFYCAPRSGKAEGYCTPKCYRENRAPGACAVCREPLARRGSIMCKTCWLTRAAKGTPKGEFEEHGVRVRKPRSRTSQRRGVSRRRDQGTWSAYVWEAGKKVGLGTYQTEHEAIAAVDTYEGVSSALVDGDLTPQLGDFA